METSANGSRLRVVPMYLNVSESTIEYENEGTNSETIKDFAEGVYSYIDDLQAQIDELKKAVQPTNSEVSEN